MRCLRSEFDRCRTLLNREYKFYLSFENSNCDYYITEKFYENGLRSAHILSCAFINTVKVKVKVGHTRLPSVGFWS